MIYFKQLKKMYRSFLQLSNRDRWIYVGLFAFAGVLIFIASAGMVGCLEGLSAAAEGGQTHGAIWYGLHNHFFGSLLFALFIGAVVVFAICRIQIMQEGGDE